MDISPYLRLMVDKDASDLFFYVGAPPHIKIEGTVRAIGNKPIPPAGVEKIAYSVMDDDHRRDFEREHECNYAISMGGVGRFRANVFRQRGEVAMVVRYIRGEIPNFEQLHLPRTMGDLVMEKRGLILVVGSTGSGKSTSLAAMIDHRNRNATGHILTIEDPIEFIHDHQRSVVGQREVGLDTLSYANALKNALREAPDVILIGEIRDEDTMRHAIHYAETGHLCLSTLHSNNANGALDRIINFFPESAREQLLLDLSANLRAVVSQRLILGLDGKRVPAVEVLLNTPYVADLIQKGKLEQIKDAMTQGVNVGMQTFDQALYTLFKSGKISEEDAVKNADSKNNVALQIRLSRGVESSEGLDDLTIKEDEELRRF